MGNFRGFIFIVFVPGEPQNGIISIHENLYSHSYSSQAQTVGYYDDVLRAYNKNKTNENMLSRPDNDNLTERKCPTINYTVSSVPSSSVVKGLTVATLTPAGLTATTLALY